MIKPSTLLRAKPSAKCELRLSDGLISPVWLAKLGRSFVSHPDTKQYEFPSEEEALVAAIGFQDAIRKSLKR